MADRDYSPDAWSDHVGAELAAIVRLAPPDGATALLDVLERELRPLRPDLPWPALDAVRARLDR